MGGDYRYREARRAERRIKTTDRDVDRKARELIREFGGYRRASRSLPGMTELLVRYEGPEGDEAYTRAFWLAVQLRIEEYGRMLPWWRRLLGF